MIRFVANSFYTYFKHKVLSVLFSVYYIDQVPAAKLPIYGACILFNAYTVLYYQKVNANRNHC